MRSAKRVALVCVAVLSGGCTLAPRYERPNLPVPAEFAATASTLPADNAAATQLSWEQYFLDPRLRSLLGAALANNRDLRKAAFTVLQSQAQYHVTRADSVPSVQGTLTDTQQPASGITGRQWSAEVASTAFELDLFGRLRSLNREALEQYFATVEAQRGTALSLVAEVANQYFLLMQINDQIDLARRTLESQQQTYKLNQLRFQAGLIAELDLRAAEAQVQTAKLNLIDYDRQQAQVRNLLQLLVGGVVSAQTLPGDTLEHSMTLADIPAGLPADLLERRPDILQAEHALKAANADIGAARAAFFPRLTLTGSVGRASDALSHLFDAGTRTWSFVPQVTMPLFAGGRNRASLQASLASRDALVAAYEKAIQSAFREVSDALNDCDHYAQAEAVAVERSRLQERRRQLADTKYRFGADTFLSLLLAQQDLYTAQQSELIARFNRRASQLSLFKSLGGGWP